VKRDLGLERQFLHAHALRFAHPVSGAALKLDSPLPADLDAALVRARGS
jgi:23S rRNA-/tRNA-specific pseudouridylate synthase